MNEITAITPQVKDKKRCNVFIDGRFCCGLTLEAAIKNRLKVGQSISPERLSEIQLESEKATALDKALSYVSSARKTEKQMRDFLRQKGYLSAVSDYVIGKMRGYNFLNDGEYAEAYTQSVSAKKGGRLIRMELRAKGISEEEINGALESLGQETEETAAGEILRKYMRGKEADRLTLQKAFRYLMGKGFDADTIKAVLSRFGDLDEE